ncbi:MAG: TlpA family protein disulfide reductase [Sporolactobacillus sp.]|jgi:thiol-disulfide isomerase/thioredoxin|nr:TlpA family protein disulfide reductase [Sporolactobacillus sp.]
MKKELIMPDLSLASHWAGRRVTTAELLGSPALIHFWSISCPKCIRSLPVIRSIAKHCRGKLRTVAVHQPLGTGDMDADTVAKTFFAHHMNEPLLIDNRRRLAAAFGNRYVPAYYLFDDDGRLVEYQLGERGALRIDATVRRLIGT